MKRKDLTAEEYNQIWRGLIYECRQGLNNEQLINGIAHGLHKLVDFPLDRRTKEYKEKLKLVNQAAVALRELAKVLN